MLLRLNLKDLVGLRLKLRASPWRVALSSWASPPNVEAPVGRPRHRAGAPRAGSPCGENPWEPLGLWVRPWRLPCSVLVSRS